MKSFRSGLGLLEGMSISLKIFFPLDLAVLRGHVEAFTRALLGGEDERDDERVLSELRVACA